MAKPEATQGLLPASAASSLKASTSDWVKRRPPAAAVRLAQSASSWPGEHALLVSVAEDVGDHGLDVRGLVAALREGSRR